MKTSDESKPLVDLIFENRNQSYGAYTLRKSYSKNVMEGVLASMLIVALVLSYPQLCKLLGIEQAVFVPKPEKHVEIILEKGDGFREVKVKPKHAGKAQANKNLPPRVTAALVPDIEPVPSPPEVITPGTEGDIDVPSSGGDLPSIDELPDPAIEHGVVDFAQFMPEFPGGVKGMMQFLNKNLKYPRMAKQLGLEGRVFVQFVVDYEGKVVDVKVITGISQDCDKEAARVIAMFPKWKPGRQGSNPVSIRMVLPIKYTLEN